MIEVGATEQGSGRQAVRTVFLCWLAILSEGYDVGAVGAILPSLIDDPAWHLTPVQAGAMGSFTLSGMLAGGILAGTLADILGRKPLFLLCLVLFSLSMAGAAWSSTPVLFILFRLAGGLGLGGIIPVTAAFTAEYSPPARKSFCYGLMYSGYSAGILAAALAAIGLLPVWGWRGVMAVGAVPLLFVPVVAWLLPESQEAAAAKRQREGRGAGHPAPGPVELKLSARAVLREIFAPDRAFATACFWTALFMGLLMVYGLNTWLPQIMRKGGYDLGSSLSFLAVFSVTSALGGILAGAIADRTGIKVTVTAAYLMGALGIAALTLKGSLAVNYLLVALAGFGSISATLILTSYLANDLPPAVRSAGTGWGLSFARIGAICGPLLGGYVASLAAGPALNFYVFSAAGLISAVAVMLIPAKH